MDDKTEEMINEVNKVIIKEAYNDVGKPILKTTGQIAGLIPRAIKAALLPLEKWILGREYNLKEIEKLLQEKLKDEKPENIEEPEAYIAVPVLQSISYCMDSDELRNMYANLLASSMQKLVREEVHPGYSDIIRQLSPDEAKILREIYKYKSIPLIGVRYENENGEGIDIVKKFSNIGEKIECEYPYNIASYLDNLERLGLIKSTMDTFFTDEYRYDELKNHKKIKELEDIPMIYKNSGQNRCTIKKGISSLTSYGISFCKICVIK